MDVGIDIENLERVVKPLEIARRYFTPRELEALRATSEAARSRAFLAACLATVWWIFKTGYHVKN